MISTDACVVDSLDVERAAALVRFVPHKEWDWLAPVKDLTSCESKALLGNEPGRRFVWMRAGAKDLALASVFFLPWDTQVLGVPSARALVVWLPEAGPYLEPWLACVREAAWNLGARLLDVKIDTRALAAARAFHRAGFYLADCLLSYGLPFDRRVAPAQGVRPAAEGDRAAVIDLAATVFSDAAQSQNRFVSDPHLGPGPASSLYAAWATNAVEGRASDAVFVADEPGAVAGFIACRTLHGPWEPEAFLADIPLNAVRPASQGRGHYKRLVQTALAWAASRGCNQMHIRTQITAGAVHRTWVGLGARIVRTLYTFHAFREADQ